MDEQDKSSPRRQDNGLGGVPLSSRLLARHIRERRFANPEEAGWASVHRAIIDTYTVAVAASHEPVVQKLRRVLLPQGADFQFWATSGDRCRPDDAALINGTAAHALDFDDVCPEVRGHPSVVLLPAILAAASPKSTLLQLCEAYAVGFEVGALLAQALPGEAHYARGWHATSTLGTLMATAAVVRLRRMTETEAIAALGIAGSMAAGNRQNFGTMTKPLHAGLAARNGVLAVSLAAEGVTADPSQIEGKFGFLALFGGEDGPSAVTLPTGPSLVSKVGLNIKRHPCCFFTHLAIDAALALREEGLDPAEVVSVDVEVQSGGLAALQYSRPGTGLQAKFSMEYCVSVALTKGVLTLADFTDDAVDRPEVRALVERVSCHEAGQQTANDRFAVVTVRTHSRGTVEKRCTVTVGDARNPLSDQQLLDKARSCLEAGGTAEVDAKCDELHGVRPSMTLEHLSRTLSVKPEEKIGR